MTDTTDVVISEKSMLEFFSVDSIGTAVSRMSRIRIALDSTVIVRESGRSSIQCWMPRFRGA
jgi:hypothetical protein